jgi:adenylylsulfate kinase
LVEIATRLARHRESSRKSFPTISTQYRTMRSVSLLRRSPGIVIWLTGLSGAGKSTIADALNHELAKTGVASVVLDGDDIRAGLNSDLGFSAEDRLENVRRLAHVARLISSWNQVVIVAAITPGRAMRELAKSIVGAGFREVFVNTPLAVCEARDPKGLYQKARSGALKSFTGVSDMYELPASPDLVLCTDASSLADEIQSLRALIDAAVADAPGASASTSS